MRPAQAPAPARSLSEIVREAMGELTSPRRPIGDPSVYLDPSEAPREGYGATALKNLVGAAMALQPDPVELRTKAVPELGLEESVSYVDPAFGMGSMGRMGNLKKAFAGSRVGKLTGGAKPWEMSPDDWVRFMRDKVDPQLESAMQALDWSPTAQGVDSTFSRRVNPRENYENVTGARAIDLSGSADPNEINAALSKLRGIWEPKLSIQKYFWEKPANFMPPSSAVPSTNRLRTDFPPRHGVLGSYSPRYNEVVLYRGNHDIHMPLSARENTLAGTLAHELEHAYDHQSGLSRLRPSKPEVNFAELPRGPWLWRSLTPERRELLKSFGKVDGKPSRLSDARGPKNQYVPKMLEAINPRAAERVGSVGHFATIDNFETDWALKSMVEQAMQEGLDVHPEARKLLIPRMKP